MTRNELIKAITADAQAQYAERGDVDTAVIAEPLGEAFDEHFPAWDQIDSKDQIALLKLINEAVSDGIERALIAEYDNLIDKHDLPDGDAWEAIHSDISEEARRDVSAFILKWEKAGI